MISSKKSWRGAEGKSHLSFILSNLCGFLFLFLVPSIHMGVVQRIWVTKPPVDKGKCTCDCWDTIFKGSYEGMSPNYRSGYKHIYFNVTSNVLFIWGISLLFLLWTFQCVRFITQLILHGHLRISMVIVVGGSIYPHYYSWWMWFNYLNDEFYSQWNHQMFFSITELAATSIALYLCDSRVDYNTRLLLCMISIASAHIFISASDQFLHNLFIGNETFKKSRDIGFLIGDCLTVLLGAFDILRYSKDNGLGRWAVSSNEVGACAIFVTFLVLVATLL
ncbi:unnamed protein product [Owenia fusiformis]|uniref:Uncharacterized protein n=1 Tax=Owenia fusiformis TaxID=6347 RepID=A0A8S4P8A7_OWEFU|nr:unnamed protein product [Owenia fusiformis]